MMSKHIKDRAMEKREYHRFSHFYCEKCDREFLDMDNLDAMKVKCVLCKSVAWSIRK